MMTSDAQKAAVNRWQAANMKVLGVKVKRDYAQHLQAVMAARGDTVNAVLRAALDEYLAAHGEPWEPDSGPGEEPGEEK